MDSGNRRNRACPFGRSGKGMSGNSATASFDEHCHVHNRHGDRHRRGSGDVLGCGPRVLRRAEPGRSANSMRLRRLRRRLVRYVHDQCAPLKAGEAFSIVAADGLGAATCQKFRCCMRDPHTRAPSTSRLALLSASVCSVSLLGWLLRRRPKGRFPIAGSASTDRDEPLADAGAQPVNGGAQEAAVTQTSAEARPTAPVPGLGDVWDHDIARSIPMTPRRALTTRRRTSLPAIHWSRRALWSPQHRLPYWLVRSRLS